MLNLTTNHLYMFPSNLHVNNSSALCNHFFCCGLRLEASLPNSSQAQHAAAEEAENLASKLGWRAQRFNTSLFWDFQYRPQYLLLNNNRKV